MEDKFAPWKYVPDNTIIAITEVDEYESSINEIIVDFNRYIKRNWFNDHAYYCLPLTIANQYGFGIKSTATFDIIWNGGESIHDTQLIMIEPSDNFEQFFDTHFGSGIVTVQNRFSLHTPKGVNLFTMNPPNMFIDGLTNMNGVIETDNIKRDFTFNIKVTRPNHKIRINKGDIISAFMPIQRYFVDPYKVKSAREVTSDEFIKHIRQAGKDFSIERQGPDREKPHESGRRYFNGEDVYGCPFHDHQKRFSKKSK